MRVKLVVAYGGAGFRGFAANEGVRTVAGVLTGAISTIVRRPVTLTGAGRTDAGVNAWGQVVSLDLPDDVDLDELARRLTRWCGPDVVVRSAEVVTDDFDARFSALWRHYRYDVWNAGTPNPLLSGRSWHVGAPLDVTAMTAAAAHVVGEHDFASFCRRPKVADGVQPPSLVRRVVAAAWSDVTASFSGATRTGSVQLAPQDADAAGSDRVGERLLRFEVRANAFCHQMVRSIVGTLVDVGAGKLAADELPAILSAGDRRAAGQVAPPHGLTLWEVGY